MRILTGGGPATRRSDSFEGTFGGWRDGSSVGEGCGKAGSDRCNLNLFSELVEEVNEYVPDATLVNSSILLSLAGTPGNVSFLSFLKLRKLTLEL